MSRPWTTLESRSTPEGVLELRQRSGTDFLITLDGRILMNSGATRSEELLAGLACRSMLNRRTPRVLIGGLGMGFTLKAALDELPADAVVVVAEINQVVVEWCRGPLYALTGGAVDDPRVGVVTADVASLIHGSAVKGDDDRFDSIILDLYEGPFEAAHDRGEHLYGDKAIATSRAALVPGGVLAVWSEEPDKAFERRLVRAGFSLEKHRPPRGNRHVVYIALKNRPHPSGRVQRQPAREAGRRSPRKGKQRLAFQQPVRTSSSKKSSGMSECFLPERAK